MPRIKVVLSIIIAVTFTGAQSALADRPNPDERRVLFGELHLHTAYSLDAWALIPGLRTTPDEAYKFARGETITYMGKPVKRAWPLDFTAVTDHAEYIGVLNQLDDPNSPFAKTEIGQQFEKNRAAAYFMINRKGGQKTRIPGLYDEPAIHAAWEREKSAANDNYEPGKFTTFIAYEWTAAAEGKYHLHRNVIFRGATAPEPFSALDSERPEDLWTYLETARAHGYDVLAIPHNANLSGGLDFDWNKSDGQPIDQAYALRRVVNEPLTEIAQNKGQSDTVPEISPADEFADFEVFQNFSQPGEKDTAHGSFVREGYGRGLVIQQRIGINPFKYGIVAGSDIHNGLSTSDENAIGPGPYGIDPNTTLPEGDDAKHALNLIDTPSIVDRESVNAGRPPRKDDLTKFSSGGLTGVWAEENTRDSIFDALRRKETFGTSGTRIRLRFFGGWHYADDILSRPGWVHTAYAEGVPMGGDLPHRPKGAAPVFIVQAMKAPDSGNLDRIQIIKIWSENGSYGEKIFDVALSDGRHVDPKTGKAPDVGNTVDLKTATYTNSIGATELESVWKDPEFKPSQPAVYYVRVLEIPTPRWTTILAAKRNLPLPQNRPPTIQERAWASPIWYTPTDDGAAGRK